MENYPFLRSFRFCIVLEDKKLLPVARIKSGFMIDPDRVLSSASPVSYYNLTIERALQFGLLTLVEGSFV